MGINALLDKLGDMLQPDASNKKHYRKKLKVLLKDLKKKEVQLQEKLESTEDEHKHKRLMKELDIVHAQRKKGIEALESSRKEEADKEDAE